MKYKTKNEFLIEYMENYLSFMKKLSNENPELAKVEARGALVKIGILDKDGKVQPPYNGEKLTPDDFERGPKRVYRIHK